MTRDVEITTRDGVCPASLHAPDAGAWPGVLMLMDAPGMRPALRRLADRLARSGFCVLLPDLFYRAGRYAPIDAKAVWADPSLREAHRVTRVASATIERVMADIPVFLAFLDADPAARPGPYGVVGYCMGGRLALIAAGTFPDRFGAAASYHGGGLANDAPASPHLLAPTMRAKVYVAGAIEDANFDDAQKERLERALAEAGVDHRVETYPARHGWVPDDTAAHDPAEAEHHWRTLVPFLRSALAAA